MFTVVIAEQTHLDSIREYGPFLKPFLDNSHIAFCGWKKDGENLEEAVPELNEAVSRHENWRLIVVCDEEGLHQKNPFDLVRHEDPAVPADMDDIAYLALRRQARLETYAKAARKPLTRLMTWLCKAPLVTPGWAGAEELDPEFGEYLAQARAKEALRSEIMGSFVPEITLPAEIICLAKRCFDREARDIREAWSALPESQYSRFCDWNLYFDKMRFLVFDILPNTHRNYIFDYIRFLYTLMLLASHDTPMGALKPHGLYLLDCNHDEKALRSILCRYDGMLAATQEKLRSEILKVRSAIPPRLSDEDAETIFRSRVNVPVSSVQAFDYSDLYVVPEDLGLAGDCPSNEAQNWSAGYSGSRSALGRYMKLPRRILRKTTSELHRINKADLEQADRLNEFQLEDVRTFVEEEELKMVDTRTDDLYDSAKFSDAMEEQSKRVSAIIEQRMTRKWTVILGVAALVCHVVGFVPMLISNLIGGKPILYSLVLLVAGAGILALAALVTLLCLRHKLRRAYSDYNGTMRSIITDVEGNLKQYSKYLSHACNVMRGNSVLEHCENGEAPDAAKLRILKKHALDVRRVREELHEIFGTFLTGGLDGELVESYPYDFYRPVEYTYPIPFHEGEGVKIDFLQRGNLVQVPVDFVKSMGLRREELYE